MMDQDTQFKEISLETPEEIFVAGISIPLLSDGSPVKKKQHLHLSHLL